MELGLPFRPTSVVVHPKENLRKCSLWPVRYRKDFVFVPYQRGMGLRLDGYVRLPVIGPPLTPEDASCGLVVLDGSWRWVASMEADFRDVPPRSLQGFRTAYPRVSKLYQDPAEGLASVEAVYIAYRLLRRPTQGLLAHYRWAVEFLESNGWEDPGALQKEPEPQQLWQAPWP
jgi:pre-rRNA-processing protein TSR3